jgi:hypothetical protein
MDMMYAQVKIIFVDFIHTKILCIKQEIFVIAQHDMFELFIDHITPSSRSILAAQVNPAGPPHNRYACVPFVFSPGL